MMPSSKTAIITGITGQDGGYLASLLLRRNYRVVGLVRNSAQGSFESLEYLNILHKLTLEECDLLDITRIIGILNLYQPDEIYNLAAQSSVSLSFSQPVATFQFNTLS